MSWCLIRFRNRKRASLDSVKIKAHDKEVLLWIRGRNRGMDNRGN